MDDESYIFDPLEPYDVAENAYRTDGKDVCHWCALRPPEWLWQPFGTRTCSLCDDLIDEGRAWEVVEGAAARVTVRGNWRRGLDPERFRQWLFHSRSPT